VVLFAVVLLVFMVCCCYVVICDAYQNSGVNGTLGQVSSKQSQSSIFIFGFSVEKQRNSLSIDVCQFIIAFKSRVQGLLP
jgi:hypothetical protein